MQGKDGKGQGKELQPVWSCGPILLQTIIDLLETGNFEDEECEEDDMNYDELLEYLDDA